VIDGHIETAGGLRIEEAMKAKFFHSGNGQAAFSDSGFARRKIGSLLRRVRVFHSQVRFLVQFLLVVAASAGEWPTYRGDLQRSGYYPSFPEGKMRLVWRQELWRELTGPRTEVIVGGGRAYLGTYAGKMHAWNAATGEEAWSVQTGGPIGHSAAYSDGALFFGSMDRTLRSVDAATGQERWRFQAEEGVWVAPCVTKDLVLFGDRTGTFHALEIATGQERWRCQTGGPVLTTASVSEDGTRVLFASEDMIVRCVSTSDGKLLWQSRKLPGLSLRDYAPVIAHGLAFITSNPVKDFHAILDEHQRMLLERTGSKLKDLRYIPGSDGEIAKEQQFIVEYLKAHRDEQTFHVLRMNDGTEPFVAPILYTSGLHNPPTPPCVDRETGAVYVQLRSAYGIWDGGGEVRPFTCFGKLDCSSGRVELLRHSYASKEADRPPGAKDTPWGTFNYIGDETQALSCAPGMLFSNHQGTLGMFELATGKLQRLFGKRDSYAGYYGPAAFGWENEGGLEKAAAANQPYGVVNEWHGPARSIASVAEGRVYYHSGAQVLCFEPEK
jgi:outer membrane protein assembly factor BamB